MSGSWWMTTEVQRTWIGVYIKDAMITWVHTWSCDTSSWYPNLGLWAMRCMAFTSSLYSDLFLTIFLFLCQLWPDLNENNIKMKLRLRATWLPSLFELKHILDKPQVRNQSGSVSVVFWFTGLENFYSCNWGCGPCVAWHLRVLSINIGF